MKNFWQKIAALALAAALATSGHAGPGNGNGGNGNGNGNGNGKGNGKPDKEQKEKPNKPGKPSNEDKKAEQEARKAEREAEKEARKAEREAAKAEREAQKAADKAAREAAKAAKKASKGTTTALSLGQIIISDSRIVDLTGDYVVSNTLVLSDGTSETTTVSLSLLQDERGRLTGNAVLELADGSTTEIVVIGELAVEGDELTLELSGEVVDELGSASVIIGGLWNGTAFDTTIDIEYNETAVTVEGEIIPVIEGGVITIEPALDAHIIGNKIWGTREVVLPWGIETVRSQQMNKKGLKFMMHSGEFGIDIRGTQDATTGTVVPDRVHLHLGYGTFFVDPALVTVLPAVQ